MPRTARAGGRCGGRVYHVLNRGNAATPEIFHGDDLAVLGADPPDPPRPPARQRGVGAADGREAPDPLFPLRPRGRPQRKSAG